MSSNLKELLARARLRLGLPVVIAVLAVMAQMPRAKADDGGLEVWLNPGFHSFHFDRDKNFRENNLGLGAEVLFRPRHAVAAGSFINSDRARSHYLAYEWRPLEWQPAGMRLTTNVVVGAFDGYPHYRNGGWFPAALPMLALEGQRFGLNLLIIPTIANRLDGAIALQLKLRVW